MRIVRTAAVVLLCLAALGAQEAKTFSEARKGFVTKLSKRDKDDSKLDEPAAGLFTIVKYAGPAGQLQAYLGTTSKAGKQPAMIWITGGFPPGGAGASAWGDPDLSNEQTAQGYRNAGMVMMYPTVRGSYGNPGVNEAFLGEVDDILAAIEHLKKVDYVDPARIYLGGHSTGGTLALLVAAASDQIKGVFAFGPIDDPANYGKKNCPYNITDPTESRLRAPINWLADIKSSTLIIEGERGNSDAFKALQSASKNPAIKFISVKGADHFDYLGAAHPVVAKKLVGGTAAPTAADIQTAFDEHQAAGREAADLRALADARRAGHLISSTKTIRFRIVARTKAPLQAAVEASKGLGFELGQIEARKDDKGQPYFALLLKKKQRLGDLAELFANSAKIDALCTKTESIYSGWDVE